MPVPIDSHPTPLRVKFCAITGTAAIISFLTCLGAWFFGYEGILIFAKFTLTISLVPFLLMAMLGGDS